MGWDETRYVTGKGVVDTGLVELCGESSKKKKRAFVFRLDARRVSDCVGDVVVDDYADIGSHKECLALRA